MILGLFLDAHEQVALPIDRKARCVGSNMNANSQHPSLAVLKSFYAEMHAWESKESDNYKAIDWDNITEEELEADRKVSHKRLTAIFEEHCEVGAKAQRLQDAGAFQLDQSEYDLDKEEILSVREVNDRVVVEVKQNHSMKQFRKFELVEREGAWLIKDNVKWRFKETSNWSAGLL